MLLFALSLMFFFALWTYPNEFQTAPDYFVIARPTEAILNGSEEGCHGDVTNTAAPDTANVIVIFYLAIEPLLGPSQIQFLYKAAFG